MIPYQRYIDFAKQHKNASDDTITSYNNSIKACGMYEFDTENVNAVWKALLVKLKAGVSYGAIRIVMILTQAALRLEGRNVVKDYDFNILEAELAKCGTVPKGYTIDIARQILKIMECESLELFRIIILQIYAGLRISACYPLPYDIFVKVEPYDIYCFPVTSKGKRYIAAISGYALRLIQQTNYEKKPLVVELDPNCKSPFDILYRKKFVYILKKHAMTDLLKERSPFHSFRKLFAQLLAESKLEQKELGGLMGHSTEGLDLPAGTTAVDFAAAIEALKRKVQEEKKLLMGHSPDSVAYKHYIDSNDPGLYQKVAAAYSKTKLMELKIYDK